VLLGGPLVGEEAVGDQVDPAAGFLNVLAEEAFAEHAEFLHDAAAGGVFGEVGGGDFVQAKALEAEGEQGACRFGGKAAVPVMSAKPVADLGAGAVGFAQEAEADGADKMAGVGEVVFAAGGTGAGEGDGEGEMVAARGERFVRGDPFLGGAERVGVGNAQGGGGNARIAGELGDAQGVGGGEGPEDKPGGVERRGRHRDSGESAGMPCPFGRAPALSGRAAGRGAGSRSAPQRGHRLPASARMASQHVTPLRGAEVIGLTRLPDHGALRRAIRKETCIALSRGAEILMPAAARPERRRKFTRPLKVSLRGEQKKPRSLLKVSGAFECRTLEFFLRARRTLMGRLIGHMRRNRGRESCGSDGNTAALKRTRR
jgi:hypothetical protein